MQGIYKISCSQENLVYIGSSKSIESRFIKHKTQLRNSIHHCESLQLAWDAYGEDSFTFSILEHTEDYIKQEQKWIDKFWPNCYNTHKKAFSSMEEETITKMLNTKYEKYGNYSATAILKEENVLEIIELINKGHSQYSIAKLYGISNCTVFNIKAGRSWKHLNHLVKVQVKSNLNMSEKKEKALSLYEDGFNKKEIALKMNRSVRTVERWLKSIA